MNIFGKGTFTWWQMGIFKIALLSLGIAIGAYWHGVFSQYLATLLTIAVVSSVYIAYVWFRR